MWCNDYLNMLQMTKETVLHKAVLNGNIDIVKAILTDKRFTEFNAKDRVNDIPFSLRYTNTVLRYLFFA